METAEIGPEGTLQAGQSIVNHRLIQNAHKGTEDNDHHNDPFVRQSAQLSTAGRKLHRKTSSVRGASTDSQKEKEKWVHKLVCGN